MNDVWEPLARLAAYPDENTIADARAALPPLQAAAPRAAAAIGRFLDATSGMPLADLQAHYAAVFDFDPACALDLGWHLFGEWRERGAFLAALKADLRRVAVPPSVELPDHLTHVLRLIARDSTPRAIALAAIVAAAADAVRQALDTRGSPYVHVLAAVHQELDALAQQAIATR